MTETEFARQVRDGKIKPVRPSKASRAQTLPEPRPEGKSPQGAKAGRKGTYRTGVLKHPVGFVVDGRPVGKPRQTQSDKWKKRDCVLKYRAWADRARAKLLEWTDYEKLDHTRTVIITAYVDRLTRKIDIDNILKAVLDALIVHDEKVVHVQATKLIGRERVEITIKP